jgi:hypothetical protein
VFRVKPKVARSRAADIPRRIPLSILGCVASEKPSAKAAVNADVRPIYVTGKLLSFNGQRQI